MNDRDKRLINNKKRLSKKYDDLFKKIIDILIEYRLRVKDWNITELKKYNRLAYFNADIKNLLKDFTKEELKIVNEILVEEFNTVWKDTQKNMHKRVKMLEKTDIENIVNYRNKNDGLTVEERNKRNIEFLQYKIYSTVTKNLQSDKDFDKLINVDLQELKHKYVTKTANRQLQDDITQTESLSTIFLCACLNNNYKTVYNTIVKNDYEEENAKENEEEYELEFTTVGDERVCRLCNGYAGQHFKADGSFTIPDNTHPNCRCMLIPIKKDVL